MGYADTDVAEFVYTNKPSVDELMKFLCKDLSKACAKGPPPVPKVSPSSLVCTFEIDYFPIRWLCDVIEIRRRL